MPDAIADLLNNTVVRAALKQAWQDSNPGESGGHETGGFIVQTAQGGLRVIRWPMGSKDGLNTLPHVGCKINDENIIATFHTHPNTGADYVQEPSDVDVDAIRDDIHLKGENYIGEFVVTIKHLYHISPTGIVSIAVLTNHVLWILP